MVASFPFVRHCLGPSFYGEGDFFKLTWLFYENKAQNGLESHSSMHFLNNLEGNK